MKFKLFIFCLCVILFYLQASVKPLGSAVRFSSPPQIDGLLTEPCWGDLTEFSHFTIYRSQGELSDIQTSVKTGFDEQYLYLGLRCQEPVLNPVLNQMQLFRVEASQADSPTIYKDENIEIFLDSGDRGGYRYLVVNPDGLIFDALNGYAQPEKWNSGATAKTFRDTESWYIEAAIPLEALSEQKIIAGQTIWRVNFCRNRRITEPVSSSWSPAPGGFHQPSSFAELHFVQNASGVSGISLRKENAGNILLNALAKNTDGGFLQAVISFDNQDQIFLQQPLTDGQLEMKIPGLLGGNALAATLGGEGDRTQTLLKSKSLPVQPENDYLISAVIREAFRKTDPSDYNFFLIRPLPGGKPVYHAVTGMELSGQGKGWRQITGYWRAPAGVESMELWLVKWAGRGIEGKLEVTDIAIKEASTGREIISNGSFIQNQAGWPVLQTLSAGYGAGSTAFQYRYSLVDKQGREWYRSALFRHRVSQANVQISSTLAYQSATNYNILPLTSLALCTGEVEKCSLFLNSAEEQSDPVILELKVPVFARLFSPDGQTALAPLSISETSISENGVPLRFYRMAFDPSSINCGNDPGWQQCEIPLLMTTAGPFSPQSGLIRRRAILHSGESEPWQNLSVSMLPPLPGRSPENLPLISWAYPSLADLTACSKAVRERLILKQRRSGFNHFRVSQRQIEEYTRHGGIPFTLLPTVTIAGSFPLTSEFLSEHPQYAAVMADGSKSAGAVCPSYILSPGNEYEKVMRKVFKMFTDQYDHLNWDYEFPFMPGAGCQARAQTGFSPANLNLFRKKAQIPEDVELNSSVIFEKYAASWRDFRNGQIADIFKVYHGILKGLKPDLFFSAYSGYPPHSDEHYGIDWNYVSPHVDLVMAGYGGNDQNLMEQLDPRQRYLNSGILIMDYFDPSGLEINLGSKLTDAGSYMIYYHFLVDGNFFLKCGRASAIAADFEKFFLNLRGSRCDDLLQSPVFHSRVLSCSDEYLALLFNESGSDKTDILQGNFTGYVAVDHERGELLNPQSMQVTIQPQSLRALYFLPRERFEEYQAPIPEILPVDADQYPVLRWKVPSSALLHYSLRYSRKADMSSPVTILSSRSNTFLQIRESLSPGKLYWQVQSQAFNGNLSQWSTTAVTEILPESALEYQRSASYSEKGGVRFWSAIGGLGVTFNVEEMMIENPFKTYAFWSNCHGSHGGNRPIKVRKGEIVTVQAMVRTANEASHAHLKVLLQNNSRKILSNQASGTSSQEWTPLSCRITAPENAVVEIQLCSQAGTVWFDQINVSVNDGFQVIKSP